MLKKTHLFKNIAVKTCFIFCLLLSTACFAENAVIVWVSEFEDSVTQVNIQRMTNNKWLSAEAIYSSREMNFSPTIGSNKLGDIMVVWTSKSTGRSIGRAVLFRNGKWQDNKIIANQGGQVTTPAVVFDSKNNAHIVWVSDHNGLDDVYHRQWRANDDQWTEPKMVNEINSVPDILPAISLDRNRDVLVQWQSISSESNNYSDFSHLFETNKFSTRLANTPSLDQRRQLSYSDITMPKEWKGSIGAAVIHFPDNDLLRQQKLPQHMSKLN